MGIIISLIITEILKEKQICLNMSQLASSRDYFLQRTRIYTQIIMSLKGDLWFLLCRNVEKLSQGQCSKAGQKNERQQWRVWGMGL